MILPNDVTIRRIIIGVSLPRMLIKAANMQQNDSATGWRHQSEHDVPSDGTVRDCHRATVTD
jgi:hypothetical protein